MRKGKAAVQRVMGYMRKAITEFRMIENGDRIAVGVSGGKDSVALLVGLQQLRRFIGIEYEVVALTLDPGFGGQETDYSAIAALCAEYSIPYELRRTQIGKIVFDERKEKHPCSLCARLRRGALHDSAKELSCNKLALGHHFNDVVETFMLNLFKEGRIGCFAPVTYLSRKDLTMIRPLVFAPEKEISAAIRKNGLPVVKSICPADGATAREEMKSFLLKKGIQPEQVQIQFSGIGAHNNVWSESLGRVISYNGYHTGIVYKGIVYDNLFKTGLAYSSWVDDFIGFGVKNLF